MGLRGGHKEAIPILMCDADGEPLLRFKTSVAASQYTHKPQPTISKALRDQGFLWLDKHTKLIREFPPEEVRK